MAQAQPLVASAIAAIAAVTLAACSAGPTTAASATAATSAAGSTPTPSASPSATEPTAVVAKISNPLVDPNTLALLGKEEVDSAWKFSTRLGATYAFDPTLMTTPTNELGPEDFEDLRAGMTAGALKDWDRSVRGLPDIQAHQSVNGLATVGININGSRLRSTDPVTRFAIAGGVLAFDDGDIVTTQTQTAVLHLIGADGLPVKFTAVRTVTFHLVKKGSRWKIDLWESESEPRVIESDR